MGIMVEFNPDLALRNIAEFKAGKRKLEECIPERLETGKTYQFLKSGQRNYWLAGQVPLVETKGNQQLSRPLAAVEILEATHFLLDGVPYTKGKYRVVEVFNPHDSKIHFDGFTRV
jgi:hypothetical protein